MYWNIFELKPHSFNLKLYGEEDLPQGFLDSIKEKGIREPLAVKKDGTIISGHRRWRAAKVAGIVQAPVVQVEYATELDEREAIIDFNRHRQKTFSQRMTEAEEIEVIERERARGRQVEKLKQGTTPPVVENLPEREAGRTRDKVASHVGIGSGKQYEKAKVIWQEAKTGNEVAKQLISSIDKGQATIHSAHKKINHKPEEAPPELPQGEYNIILADPPWRYEFSETSMRAIENQYPTAAEMRQKIGQAG